MATNPKIKLEFRALKINAKLEPGDQYRQRNSVEKWREIGPAMFGRTIQQYGNSIWEFRRLTKCPHGEKPKGCPICTRCAATPKAITEDLPGEPVGIDYIMLEEGDVREKGDQSRIPGGVWEDMLPGLVDTEITKLDADRREYRRPVEYTSRKNPNPRHDFIPVKFDDPLVKSILQLTKQVSKLTTEIKKLKKS